MGVPYQVETEGNRAVKTNIFTITYQLHAHSRLICTGVIYPRNVDLVSEAFPLGFPGNHVCMCCFFSYVSSVQCIEEAFLCSNTSHLYFSTDDAICNPSAFHSSLSIKSACNPPHPPCVYVWSSSAVIHIFYSLWLFFSVTDMLLQWKHVSETKPIILIMVFITKGKKQRNKKT